MRIRTPPGIVEQHDHRQRAAASDKAGDAGHFLPYFSWRMTRAALAAVVAARLHGHGQFVRAAEGADEQRHQQRHHRLGPAQAGCRIQSPRPRAICAFMILSVSSSRVGMKRRAMVIIMASSWAGKWMHLQAGISSCSMPSVRAMGEVVSVRSDVPMHQKDQPQASNAPHAGGPPA